MAKPPQLKHVIQTARQTEYRGNLHDYQTKGSRRYHNQDKDFLNNYQNYLYHRALFGLSIYSQEEIRDMHWEKRQRIIKVHKRTQRILNNWKQEIIVRVTNNFFSRIFPKSPITQELTGKFGRDIDPELKCNFSFKSLKITKEQIVSKLLAERILPQDFNELTTEPQCK